MSKEPQPKACPQVFKLDKALKVAETWVNNMSPLTADDLVEVEFEGRPPRLGLGAKYVPQSKMAVSSNPVVKKLHAKLDADRKRAAKTLEESNMSERNNEHSEDDDDDSNGSGSRANAFAKKRAMAATTLQAKKKNK